MGQGQSGQAGFPGQGQPGEKKDQVWNTQELFAIVPDDIDLHPINYMHQNHLHSFTPVSVTLKAVVTVLRFLPVLSTAKGEEEMGTTSASTTCWKKAEAGRPGMLCERTKSA